MVHLLDVTGNAFIIQIEYYTATLSITEFNTIKQEVNLRVLKTMEEMKILIAGNRTNVRIIEPK